MQQTLVFYTTKMYFLNPVEMLKQLKIFINVIFCFKMLCFILEFNNFELKRTFRCQTSLQFLFVFLVNRAPGRGPEQREPNKAVLCPLIIIILISYIIIKLLIMENHPSRNQKLNSNSCLI